MEKYLIETRILDYSNPSIQQLIQNRGWKGLAAFDRIQSIYNYVRDEILFGYNIDDDIPASKVLSDGYGQCNTKGTIILFFSCFLLFILLYILFLSCVLFAVDRKSVV